MDNAFRDLPEYGAILATLGRAADAYAAVKVPVGWQLGVGEHCHLMLNSGLIDPTPDDLRAFSSAMRRLPRPVGGNFADIHGEATLHVRRGVWRYRYRNATYVYEVSSSDEGGTAIMLEMPAPPTLTDLASERLAESYARRTRDKGLGMLPRVGCVTGMELVEGTSLIRYLFDPEAHLARRPLARREDAMAA